jgi:hypothetical protein
VQVRGDKHWRVRPIRRSGKWSVAAIAVAAVTVIAPADLRVPPMHVSVVRVAASPDPLLSPPGYVSALMAALRDAPRRPVPALDDDPGFLF